MAVHSSSRVSFPALTVKWMWICYIMFLVIWTSSDNTSVTGEPRVIGSSKVVLAIRGDDVILPCHIEPPVNMKEETVEWTRPDLDPKEVIMRQDGLDMRDQSNPLYKERAFLFDEELPRGNISLKLSRVKLSDQGKYVCNAPKLNDEVEIQLHVVGGPLPVISDPKLTDSGVSVSCVSGCWSPPPEMVWLDSDENNITVGPAVTQKYSSHCYIVQRDIIVERAGYVTCRVHLPEFTITAETRKYLPEHFIPNGTPGRAIAGIIASVIIIIIILMASLGAYIYWKKKNPEMNPFVNLPNQPMTYSDPIINDEDIRIVLVGKTGCGKSASGNTILCHEAFETKFSFKSVTKTCKMATGVVAGRKVSVIDTPGLFDTGFDMAQTLEEVRKCVTYAAPGPHVFLAVIRLGTPTDEEKNVVAKIQKAFGQSSDKYTMIIFTHGDLLQDSNVDIVNDSPEVQELIRKYGGFHVFNNKSEDPSQVTELLEKIKDMLKKNNGHHYTNQIFQDEARKQELKTLMDSSNLTAASSAHFVMQHKAQLIQVVPPSAVMSIVDHLGDMVQRELYAGIQPEKKSIDLLYTSLLDEGGTDVRAALYNALKRLPETPGADNERINWEPDQEGAIPEEIRRKTKMCIGGGLLCALIGVILLLVGIPTHYWLQYEERGSHIYQGLWKEIRCKGTACFTVETPFEYAIALISMGVILILLGVLCVIGFLIGMKSYAQNSKPSKAAGIMFLFSSATVAVSMVIYTAIAGTNLDMAYMMKAIEHWSFSWSYVLGWMASFMILLAGIFTMCAHRIRKKKNGHQDGDSNGQGASGAETSRLHGQGIFTMCAHRIRKKKNGRQDGDSNGQDASGAETSRLHGQRESLTSV